MLRMRITENCVFFVFKCWGCLSLLRCERMLRMRITEKCVFNQNLNMSSSKNRMNSCFWFSELKSEDIDAGCSALRGLTCQLEFVVIGKEKPNVYNKCILIFKKRIFYPSVPDIFKKKYCEHIPFVGKGEKKSY